jgi:hypothetical protein
MTIWTFVIFAFAIIGVISVALGITKAIVKFVKKKQQHKIEDPKIKTLEEIQ